jgi:recombination protein RecA
MSDQKRGSASLADQLRKRYSRQPIRTMASQRDRSPQPFVSIGVPAIDQALGDERLRAGEIVEIYGNDPEAEAMLICQLLAAAQQQGGDCASLDVAGTFLGPHAEQLGVKTCALLGVDPHKRLGGAAVFAIAAEFARSGAIEVLVISVPGLVPEAELGQQIGSGDPSLFNKMVSEGMRELACAMDESSTLCLLINRVTEQWNEPSRKWRTVRPAAHVLDFYVTRRLEFQPLTRDSDREADPTRWCTRLRIIGRDGSAKELDLSIEYETGISGVASR